MRRWILSGCLVVAVCLGGTACKKGGASGSSTGAASTTAPTEPQFGPKLNGYVEHCLNVFSDNVFDSKKHYFSWAPKEQAPSEKTKDIKGILSTYIDPKRCVDAVTKSNAMAPHDAALEAAGTSYGTALTALRPILDDARRYYEDRGYKVDKFAKAVQLHQALVKGFDDFTAANKALGARIDALQDEEDARDLARLERTEGRKLPFLVRASYMRAKATTHIAFEVAKSGDLATFTKSFTDVDTIVKELLAYRDAHGDEAHRAHVQGYTQDVEKFARFAREFKQKLEDKQPASPEQLQDQYNSVVNSLNGLRI